MASPQTLSGWVYVRQWAYKEHNRLRMNARRRALQRLAHAHPEEFQRFMDEEMRDVPSIPELNAQYDGSACGPVGSTAPADPHATRFHDKQPPPSAP